MGSARALACRTRHARRVRASQGRLARAAHLNFCASWRPNDLFPLTPTLSLRERESASRVLAQFSQSTFAASAVFDIPLPEGEGWGEGEQNAAIGRGLRK